MKIGRSAAQFGYSVIGMLALMGAMAAPALAQDDHSHHDGTARA